MNSPHAAIQERHDGADVCPMCFKEILYVSNQCPHCGAPVDSPGLLDLEPMKAASPKTVLLKMLVFWGMFVFYLFRVIPSGRLITGTNLQLLGCWLNIFAFAYLAIKHTREWHQQRKAKAMS